MNTPFPTTWTWQEAYISRHALRESRRRWNRSGQDVAVRHHRGAGCFTSEHQHIFAVRIDPAIDGHANTVTVEDSLPMPMEPTRNPYGNGYEVQSTTIT